jgi:hypothetical protein
MRLGKKQNQLFRITFTANAEKCSAEPPQDLGTIILTALEDQSHTRTAERVGSSLKAAAEEWPCYCTARIGR